MRTASPFTVVIPAYKSEQYIAATLESVLAQTYPAAEIIVLDDGSPDNTATVAAGFDGRIRLIRKANSGVSDTRNQGTALATTDFICFVDSDDLWTPDHLERHAAVLAENPDADVIYSGRKHLVADEQGVFHLSEAVAVPSPDTVLATLMDRCPFNPTAVSVRRSVCLAVGGFKTGYDTVEDWEFWLQLALAGARFVLSPEPTVQYRIHSTNTTTKNPLPVMRKSIRVIHEVVAPHLSPGARFLHSRRAVSRLEGEAAILLRHNRLPGALPLMLQSIARYPFHEPRRYKIAAHMLLRSRR